MAKIIDGKKVAQEIREELKTEINDLVNNHKVTPGLAVVLVGNDPASAVYVRMKKRACEELGVKSFEYILPEETSQEELLALVEKLNNDSEVNGLLVQLPLPSHIDENLVINSIKAEKDVDGFHPVNVGKMLVGDDDCFYPCTPYGCQELIVRSVDNLKGKHVVIVGRSNIVGKPLSSMMVQKNERANCIVTVCHTAAKDLSVYTRQADILVVAVGRPGTVTADMVKEGVVVIDVGTNRIPHPDDPEKTKLIGDVVFDEVSKKASAITPVPGGVGPMTITMLMKNTVRACRLQNNIK